MKKIAVVTATRAEYGLLSPIIKKLREYESDSFRVDLIVTGTHLSKQYGRTINEIDDRIDKQIEIPTASETELDISNNQAIALVEFTQVFMTEQYNAVVLLGDRYETLAVAVAAGNTRTPIFHLCGGDTTEGAIDEWIRHSITKISYLHFVTNEDSRRRVIQLGEDPSRVFNYGSTSIDNIISVANMSKLDALASVGLSDCRYALCTYHPVTMEENSVDYQIAEFLEAIKTYPQIQFIVTKSNADRGGSRINELLDVADTQIENLHVFASLGMKRYLSLMRDAEFVIGNSSSGITEAPAFHIPTINIGDRQKGRLQSKSTINCETYHGAIINAISKAMCDEHKKICMSVTSPYGDGHAADKIANKMVDVVLNGNIDLKKSFYSLGADK